ncbi:hypothetical protein [Tenacibaculum aestuarii]|uniref:hypothetical protein n=1 Tax=Tenacibaculum aestuarii TaxID=362781 RepID=UPI0038B42BFD
MTSKKWITSKEAIKLAKIKSCDLMHLRITGKLEYKKEGNSFFYTENDLLNLKSNNKN